MMDEGRMEGEEKRRGGEGKEMGRGGRKSIVYNIIIYV